MEAQIQIVGGDEVEEAAGLFGWLRGERALAGSVHVVQRSPGEGELGGGLDALIVALGSGGAGAVLARSVTAWLQTRRANVTLTVRTKSRSVTVEARGLPSGDVLALLERVLRDGDA